MFLLAWSFSDRCGLARPACPAMERPMGLYLTCWTWWLLGDTTLINIYQHYITSNEKYHYKCQIICLFNLVAIEAPSRKVVKCCIMGMQCFFLICMYIYIYKQQHKYGCVWKWFIISLIVILWLSSSWRQWLAHDNDIQWMMWMMKSPGTATIEAKRLGHTGDPFFRWKVLPQLWKAVVKMLGLTRKKGFKLAKCGFCQEKTWIYSW